MSNALRHNLGGLPTATEKTVDVELMALSIAPTTKRTYDSAMRMFFAWDFGGKMGISRESIKDYLFSRLRGDATPAFLLGDDGGLRRVMLPQMSVAAARVFLSAVDFWMECQTNFAKIEFSRRERKGLLQAAYGGGAVQRARAILTEEVEAAADAGIAAWYRAGSLRDLRNAAIFCLGWCWMLRVSDIGRVEYSNEGNKFAIGHRKGYFVGQQAFRFDMDKPPRAQLAMVWAKAREVVNLWVTQRFLLGDGGRFLFCKVGGAGVGSRLGDMQVTRIVKGLGLDAKAHGLRRGGAQGLHKAGVSLVEICERGGWKSLHTLSVYMRS